MIQIAQKTFIKVIADIGEFSSRRKTVVHSRRILEHKDIGQICPHSVQRNIVSRGIRPPFQPNNNVVVRIVEFFDKCLIIYPFRIHVAPCQRDDHRLVVFQRMPCALICCRRLYDQPAIPRGTGGQRRETEQTGKYNSPNFYFFHNRFSLSNLDSKFIVSIIGKDKTCVRLGI